MGSRQSRTSQNHLYLFTSPSLLDSLSLGLHCRPPALLPCRHSPVSAHGHCAARLTVPSPVWCHLSGGLRRSPRDGALWPTPGPTLFPLSTPAGLVQPLILSTPADTIGPALTGHPRSVHFFSQPFFLSKLCQETRASCQLVPLSLHFCPLSSSLQISYQKVLKRQPEWFIHPGSSVSQPRAQIFDHATALRPAPPVGLRITPVLSNRVLSARLPVPPPESQQLALRLPPPLKFLPLLVLSLQVLLPRLVLVL